MLIRVKNFLFCSVLLISSYNSVNAQIVTNYAGWNLSPYNGISAVAAQISPYGIASDDNNNIYYADKFYNSVYKINLTTGKIIAIAGNGKAGDSGDGGNALLAQLNSPTGIALDKTHNLLYITEGDYNRIRKVNLTTGIISTFAGNGAGGYSGDGGQSVNARIFSPMGICTNQNGDVYFTEATNMTIRKVVYTTGIISTIAGQLGVQGNIGDGGMAINAQFQKPVGITIDNAQNIYIADPWNGTIRKIDNNGIINRIAGVYNNQGFNGDGGSALSANLNSPTDIEIDNDNNLLIADQWNACIRKVNLSTGIISTIAGTGGVSGYSGDDGIASSSKMSQPISLCIDKSNNNIFVSDWFNNRIRKINPNNSKINTIAGNGICGYSGDGGPANVAQLYQPFAFAFDNNGNLCVADASNNTVRKIDKISGLITTIAGNGTSGFSGDGGLATNAQLSNPTGIAFDNNNNLYIADYYNERVRKVDNNGIISTYNNLPTPQAIVYDNVHNILYVASHPVVYKFTVNNGQRSLFAGTGGVAGNGGDGGLATAATLDQPLSLALDNQKNLYINEGGNAVIRKVNFNTNIITKAVGTYYGWDYTGDNGPATAATILAMGINFDNNNNLFIADYYNNVIRKVDMNTNIITTIAGIHHSSQSDTKNDGDGDLAINAEFMWPVAIIFDNDNNSYIADSQAHVVRKIFTANTWLGTTSTNWNVSSNWDKASVPVNTDIVVIPNKTNQPVIGNGVIAIAKSITINPNATLTISGSGLLSTVEGLVLKSESNFIANSNNYTGTVTLERKLTGQRGWRVFSNPFSTTQTFSAIASKNGIGIQTNALENTASIADVRNFSNEINDWTDAGNSTSPNKSYALFIRGLAFEVSGLNYTRLPSFFNYSTEGKLNGSSVTISPAKASNFMLVGNPYLAPIKSSSLTGQVGSTPFYSFQVLPQSGFSSDGTTLLQKSTGIWVASGISDPATTIPVLGSIMYKLNNNSSFVLSNSDLSINGNKVNNVFATKPTLSQLELIVYKESNFADKIYLVTSPNSNASGNDHYDLDKYFNEGSNLYTIASDNFHLAMDSRKTWDSAVLLGISGQKGSYYFEVKSNTLDLNQKSYLLDKKNNTKTELIAGAIYEFEISNDTTSQGERRFEIVFGHTQEVALADKNYEESASLKLNVLNTPLDSYKLNIKISGLSNNSGELTLFDFQGNIYSSLKTTNGFHSLDISKLGPGIQLLKLADTNGKSIIQKFIKH